MESEAGQHVVQAVGEMLGELRTELKTELSELRAAIQVLSARQDSFEK